MQESSASDGGFVYSVHNGDMHLFGDLVPVYVLRPWRWTPTCDTEQMQGLPSQMLDGRNRVVRFTGREAELADLRRWRRSPARFAVHWLYGEGGQGKTRLGDEFAADSVQAGWKVVVAEPGPGMLVDPHGEYDLSLGDAPGLLLIVDYADRWPFSHLIWLFSNGLLHTGRPTRVLLLARDVHVWPALRSALRREYATYRIELSDAPLAPLPDAPGVREAQFRAAVDGFADLYGLADRGGIAPARPFTAAEFGLTLALHMAALVGVDAVVTGARPPSSMADLTSYLLDREYLHWTLRHGDGTHEIDPAERRYWTPPDVMHHAVFAAALTGSMARDTGTATVARLGLPGDPGQTLADHAACYPPVTADPAVVLEPLQPDRMAEDLLALSTPGHDPAYAARWAPGTVRALLDTPPFRRRGMLYLAAAAQRWPHIGDAVLYPLIREQPELALAAGNAGLLSLAAIEQLDVGLLTAIESVFPERPDPDVDVGVAVIAERLTDLRLAEADPVDAARLQHALAWRLSNAGRPDAALPRLREAAGRWFQLAAEDQAHLMMGVLVLNDVASCLMELGQVAEGVKVIEQVVAMYRAEAVLPPAGRLLYAGSMRSLADFRADHGRVEEAVALLGEAVDMHRSLLEERANRPAEPADEAYDAEMASALDSLGGLLAKSGQPGPAAELFEEAGGIFQRLAQLHPGAYRPEVVRSLINNGMVLGDLGKPRDGLHIMEKAVGLARELAETHPAMCLPDLATALHDLSVIHGRAGDLDQAMLPTEEAVAIRRRLAADNPALFGSSLAMSLQVAGASLFSERPEEGLEYFYEAVDTLRELCEADPLPFVDDFTEAADELNRRLIFDGRPREAAAAREENQALAARFAQAARQAPAAADTRRPDLNGMLLVGSDTVLLVVDHTEDGAMALILNRPSSTTLAQAAADNSLVAPWAAVADEPEVLFEGGPDGPEAVICLVSLRPGAKPVAGMHPIRHPLYAADVRCATKPVVERARLFVGYVAFPPGVVDDAVERGDVVVAGVATVEPFSTDPHGLPAQLRR